MPLEVLANNDKGFQEKIPAIALFAKDKYHNQFRPLSTNELQPNPIDNKYSSIYTQTSDDLAVELNFDGKTAHIHADQPCHLSINSLQGDVIRVKKDIIVFISQYSFRSLYFTNVLPNTIFDIIITGG